MPIYWQATNYTELMQETWDEETFIFNPASGHTHVLNAAAAEILAILATTPTSTDQLFASLSDEIIDLDQAQLSEALNQQLSQLHTMGLIQANS